MTAPWAARYEHTTVVDAAGAIYVIGGYSYSGTCYQDVWASTDGGARPDSVTVGWSGGTTGVLSGLYGGTTGYLGVLRWYRGGTQGVSRGTRRVLGWYWRGTGRVV